MKIATQNCNASNDVMGVPSLAFSSVKRAVTTNLKTQVVLKLFSYTHREMRLVERGHSLVRFEECSIECTHVCASTGELKVNDVKRARENPEAKRENASSRVRVPTRGTIGFA